MAIRVAPGAEDTICYYADAFVLHVTGVDDLAAAASALQDASDDILALAPAGPGSTTATVVVGPGGPLLRVTDLDAPDQALRTVPGIVARHLERRGVTAARIDAPEPGGQLDGLDDCVNAAVLRVFPEPAGGESAIPATWIDVACEWVLGDLSPDDSVPMRLLGVEFDARVADAPAILHEACAGRAWCDLVHGDLDDRVRTASITFGRAPHVALAAGGPACDTAALLARFDLLCEVGRDLAPDAAYACIDVEDTFAGIGLGLGAAGWRAAGGASPNLVAGELGDVAVPDVFPFQVLGPGHLERLADVPGVVAAAKPLPSGRVELRLGEPADWFTDPEVRAEVQAEGFDLLAPVLLSQDRAADLLASRPSRVDPRLAGTTLDRRAGTPDLADIVLEAVPHARRGLRLTLLELVSWLAHEPHSDAPATVSPVLATFARWFSSALPRDRRQELKARAALMVGTRVTAAPGARSLSAADSERAWLAADWLLRVQAPAWLHLAGLGETASRVEAIGPTTNHLNLVRVVDILGSAITTASRRIELTASVAGSERADDGEIAEQVAWEAWEAVSESAGWVAASEAASAGIPADLAYTTDLRVIECARDPRVRDELDVAGRSIGDTAWATALHAVADEAWTVGWAAAHEAIDELAVMSLQTALDRATRAAATRFGLDDDGRDVAIEAAEAAAKESLTRAALGSSTWRAHDVPWDLAWSAAVASDPDGLWATSQELARAAVEDGPWEAGMAAARAAVDHVLHDAPDLVARAVGAAVGREAAGTAARAVAIRAGAIAIAQGSDLVQVADAAVASLSDTAAELQDAAFALFDVLLAVPAPATTEPEPTEPREQAG